MRSNGSITRDTGDKVPSGSSEGGGSRPVPLTRAPALTTGTILRFWLPLAATWLMMSIEGPILTMIIARLPDQETNLAAYGIAFHLGMLVESPVIMILSAATALVKDRVSLRRLRNYTMVLNGILTLVMILLSLPLLFDPFARHILNLSPAIAETVRIGVMLMIPWPAAIGIRRFYQGVLIREGRTGRVAWGTMMRVVGMVASALLLWRGAHASGIVVGTASLSIAVIAEAIAAWLMVRSSLRRLETVDPVGPELTVREITRYYYPLALTSLIGLGAPPMINLFLTRSLMPIESLAVWPVVSAFAFLFRSVGLAWQEAVITLVGDCLEQYRQVRAFTWMISLGTLCAVAAVAVTPLAPLWFEKVVGLKPSLAPFAILPMQIIAILPVTSAFLSLQRGVLMRAGRTGPISASTAVEVVVIVALTALLILGGGMVGAVAAAIAVVAGRFAALGYITVPFRRVVRGIAKRG